MRRLILIGQRWEHRGSREVWIVREVHRKDELVELARGGGERRSETFQDLGLYYTLEDSAA